MAIWTPKCWTASTKLPNLSQKPDPKDDFDPFRAPNRVLDRVLDRIRVLIVITALDLILDLDLDLIRDHPIRRLRIPPI